MPGTDGAPGGTIACSMPSRAASCKRRSTCPTGRSRPVSPSSPIATIGPVGTPRDADATASATGWSVGGGNFNASGNTQYTSDDILKVYGSATDVFSGNRILSLLFGADKKKVAAFFDGFSDKIIGFVK